MISTYNEASNKTVSDDDFTIKHYQQLLKIALNNYTVVSYKNIPWGDRFVIWRHDIDYSLNRSLVLAKVEYALGMKATYFVNPHSEFYNLAEASQHRIIRDILALGHDLGLHFDATFHGNINTEQKLDSLIAQEADYLKILFGVKPIAFSFHNPVTTHLSFEAEQYGGLVNCYSKCFKTSIAYCSDSNGYWRFRRLFDVLSDASDTRLQVLTHPGWWQDEPMSPRQRIYRSVNGRAVATMRSYDAGLKQHGRLNHSNITASLRFIETIEPQLFKLLDYLSNNEQYQTLFVELWRLHEHQISKICKAFICKQWQVPITEANAFFEYSMLSVDGWHLFQTVFEKTYQEATDMTISEYSNGAILFKKLIYGNASITPQKLKDHCIPLCQIIEKLLTWARTQSITIDTLTYNPATGDITEYPITEIPNFPRQHWDQFKASMQKTNTSGAV